MEQQILVVIMLRGILVWWYFDFMPMLNDLEINMQKIVKIHQAPEIPNTIPLVLNPKNIVLWEKLHS